ncbi:hypothetical protein [Burkholderia mallei]|uniref:hypothetical protein n=1 Tax=Burkholderia mallei TaxID=13373 RepID=UPI0004B16E83|nr:hypothetical protein [Burkholderia mallei]KOS79440.1 hypothetical protein DM53_546 [Burkholderia mallei]KOS86378.1 hypothetical protein DO61_4447 [Burkholderia mallei]KOS89219.1 hypothetical protein DM49_435 [Burkholderia mallei]KOS92385.1 hypothetical protein DM45_2771 [Burkholderia mallei]KOS96625.1 hypothetical protein DM50_2075 [Burkholderia mallei]
MNNDALPGHSPDLLDFDEDFIKIDAAICEYDSVGYAPQRKGESAFQLTCPLQTGPAGV